MIEAEAALVAASRGGDREAFEQLVRGTARLIYSRAYLETGDVHRAEDATQETLLLAWKSIRQLSDPTGLRPWLLRILHNVIVDQVRRDARKKRRGKFEESGAMMRIADRAPSPDEASQVNEQQRRALQVLRNLPEEYRQVLTLRYLAGADYDAIAQQLALTNGSLRGLLSRGLALMKQRLKERKESTNDTNFHE